MQGCQQPVQLLARFVEVEPLRPVRKQSHRGDSGAFPPSAHTSRPWVCPQKNRAQTPSVPATFPSVLRSSPDHSYRLPTPDAASARRSHPLHSQIKSKPRLRQTVSGQEAGEPFECGSRSGHHLIPLTPVADCALVVLQAPRSYAKGHTDRTQCFFVVESIGCSVVLCLDCPGVGSEGLLYSAVTPGKS
jgi:hypothetical protein